MSGCVWSGSAGSERNSGSPGVSRRGHLEPLYPLQHNPQGSPMDAEFRRSLPRGAIPARVPPKVPLPPLWSRPGGEAGVQAVFKPCFSPYLPLGAGPSPRAPRQKADSDSLPLSLEGRRGASPRHLSGYFLRAVTWHPSLRPEKPSSGPSLFIRMGSPRPSLPDVKPEHLDSRHTLSCHLPGAPHLSH